ncbi:hypothetical protein ACQY0O_008328 [Thecaphora frezii]
MPDLEHIPNLIPLIQLTMASSATLHLGTDLSKLLLHYPEAQSKIEDFLPGTSFQRFIAEPHAEEGKDALVVLEPIKCHILMVGQMYFALLNRRCENRINNVAILRIKQILLLNYKAIVLVLNKYPNANLVFSPQGLPQTCRHQ